VIISFFILVFLAKVSYDIEVVSVRTLCRRSIRANPAKAGDAKPWVFNRYNPVMIARLPKTGQVPEAAEADEESRFLFCSLVARGIILAFS